MPSAAAASNESCERGSRKFASTVLILFLVPNLAYPTPPLAAPTEQPQPNPPTVYPLPHLFSLFLSVIPTPQVVLCKAPDIRDVPHVI